jgi:hypothetical protein
MDVNADYVGEPPLIIGRTDFADQIRPLMLVPMNAPAGQPPAPAVDRPVSSAPGSRGGASVPPRAEPGADAAGSTAEIAAGSGAAAGRADRRISVRMYASGRASRSHPALTMRLV